MIGALVKKIFGTKHERTIKRLWPLVEEINRRGEALRAVSAEELRGKTEEFRTRLAAGETLDDLLPDAYAAVKEACRRLVGTTIQVTEHDILWDMVPFDVQLIGGVVLHQGKIAEMATGEGKTLVATMPLYLNALTGKGVHLVTVNDYLARRDSEWMGPIYRMLGLTVGCIQHDMPPPARREAYLCDITYGTNNEFGFDYLRDNMAWRLEDRVQRGHRYAIVDEVDSVLIDEARTPLIISGPVTESTQRYGELKGPVEALVRQQVRLVNGLLGEVEELLKDGKEDDAGVRLVQASRGMPKNKKLLKILQELGMKKLVQRVEGDYMREKRLHELDEELFFAMDEKGHNVVLTEKGRDLLSPSDPELFIIPDLAEGLHQIETEPSLSEQERREQRFALERMYAERSEKIHNISQLLKAYVLFEKDVEYVLQDGKVVIVDEFTGRLMPGRRYSDGLHMAIEAKEGVTIEGETQTLATITLQNYFRLYEKLAGMTGTAETEEDEFWQIYKLEVIVIPTNRPVRRIDYDDVVHRTKREKYNAIVEEIVREYEKGRPVLVGTISVDVSELLSRMLKRRGIKHHVLNAKYHQQEAEIVARAGQPGAVTIATNMAGRGTDIKLGPGVVKCHRCAVKAHLDKEDGPPPGDGIPPGKTVADCVADMPCGLHIVGTERHEARRIDRQLRGRSARQGDPGSGRFFLALEDDLMRLFGSDRIAGIMDKLGAQEGEVIMHPLVTRSIGRAQRKVEAHNFEIRKHLLEYDDVMNQQREVIYDLRLYALEGKDLKGQVWEMIEGAVGKKIGGRCAGAVAEEWDLKGLAEDLMVHYLIYLPVAEWTATDWSGVDLREKVLGVVREAFEARYLSIDETQRDPLLQMLLLKVIDERWKDHLYDIDHLKEGIHFRAYGQKDPLVEYKQEAYRMFVELLDSIRHEVGSLYFRAPLMAPQPARVRVPVRQVASHHVPVSAFAGAGAAAAQAPGSQQPVVAGPRVGRNDPCPCGSGLKYKRCHGK